MTRRFRLLILSLSLATLFAGCAEDCKRGLQLQDNLRATNLTLSTLEAQMANRDASYLKTFCDWVGTNEFYYLMNSSHEAHDRLQKYANKDPATATAAYFFSQGLEDFAHSLLTACYNYSQHNSDGVSYYLGSASKLLSKELRPQGEALLSATGCHR